MCVGCFVFRKSQSRIVPSKPEDMSSFILVGDHATEFAALACASIVACILMTCQEQHTHFKEISAECKTAARVLLG